MSKWAAPVLFVRKKDRKISFCIEYRKHHSMKVKETYPLPGMDEGIDTLGDAQFTRLDTYSGYGHMKMGQQDRQKMEFVCHAVTFQCTGMPFGLTNAPVCLQRALDMIITRCKWKTCLVYLEDVIILSNNVDDNIKHVNEILRTLVDAVVALKISKCHLFQRQVEYLGHLVGPGWLQIDKKNVELLRQGQPPNESTQCRSMLAFCNDYRRFIDDFTGMAHHLNKLFQKGSPETLKLDEEQKATYRPHRSSLFTTHPRITDYGASVFSWLPLNWLRYRLLLIPNPSRCRRKPDWILSKVASACRSKQFSIRMRIPRSSVGAQNITVVLDVWKVCGVHRQRSTKLVVNDWKP